MNVARFVLSFVMLLAGGTVGPAADPSSDFSRWFDEASAGRLELPDSVQERSAQYRYVFVAGLGNERMFGYFGQNARELRARGVPKQAIHYIYPRSRRTVEANRERVREGLEQAAAAGPEPLVILAHSRGACDALLFALEHPDFVDDHVAAIFLVQGPFGGTGLVDYLMGTGPVVDRKLSWGHRVLAGLLGRWERLWMSTERRETLTALSRETSRRFWAQAIHDHRAAAATISPKVYFITSGAEPARLGLLQRTMARYLGAYFGPNDGMVLTVDQSLPGLGTRLGVLNAGHADLTRRFPATWMGKQARRALIQSVMMLIGQTDFPGCTHVQ